MTDEGNFREIGNLVEVYVNGSKVYEAEVSRSDIEKALSLVKSFWGAGRIVQGLKDLKR